MAEWTEELRDRCREYNACYGEPPCFQAHPDGEVFGPCDDCLAGRPNPDWEIERADKGNRLMDKQYDFAADVQSRLRAEVQAIAEKYGMSVDEVIRHATNALSSEIKEHSCGKCGAILRWREGDQMPPCLC